MKNKKVDKVSLLVQAVLFMGVLYSYILTLFMKEFYILLIIVLGLTMFSMAYNNATIYKKRGMTSCYTIVGILCLLAGLIG